MTGEERQAAKARFLANLHDGQRWQEAAAGAGVRSSERSAFRLRRRVRLEGEASALHDGRHGHPSKLREPVRAWLRDHCRGTPQCSGREVQGALATHFQLWVSISQINRVRATLGVGQPPRDVGGKSGRRPGR